MGDHQNSRGIFRNLKPLVLASKSPRRKELLARLGVNFEVSPARGEEPKPLNEEPSHYTLRLARAKAEEVFQKNPGKAILAADTIVVCKKEILGKPKDFSDAFRMLNLLSGKMHQVFTAYVILDGQRVRERVVETRVHFKHLQEEEIKAYLATDEPWDKAGAYAIQGIASYMVKHIEGSVTNVVGLPLTELIEDLLFLQIITWRSM